MHLFNFSHTLSINKKNFGDLPNSTINNVVSLEFILMIFFYFDAYYYSMNTKINEYLWGEHLYLMQKLQIKCPKFIKIKNEFLE